MRSVYWIELTLFIKNRFLISRRRDVGVCKGCNKKSSEALDFSPLIFLYEAKTPFVRLPCDQNLIVRDRTCLTQAIVLSKLLDRFRDKKVVLNFLILQNWKV